MIGWFHGREVPPGFVDTTPSSRKEKLTLAAPGKGDPTRPPRRLRARSAKGRTQFGMVSGLYSGRPYDINDIIVAQLIVRNLEAEVVRRLRARAVRHGRSAEAEHRDILRRALVGSGDRTLGDVILAMPEVGRDTDFKRPRETPRRVRL